LRFFFLNGTIFGAKTQLFVVLPKFDRNNIFQKFKKNLFKESLNQQKMAKYVDFRSFAGRKSPWITAKKVEVSHGNCVGQIPPILNFPF
jgi:hypothetical protein